MGLTAASFHRKEDFRLASLKYTGAVSAGGNAGVILSKAGEYGVRIALQLAVDGAAAGYVPVRELSRRCDVPVYFLGKICHRMTRAGILDSHKGPNGGVTLARAPRSITLLEVVEALDGLEVFKRCFLGLPFCGEEPCPVHDTWSEIKSGILAMLSTRTLEQVAADVVAGKAVVISEGT